LALLFLAIGGVNLLFASRRGQGDRWNIVMGVVGVFTGGVLAVLGDDGTPVLFAAVPAMLIASYLHTRATREEQPADESFDPPV
jgi:hypothetical protein